MFKVSAALHPSSAVSGDVSRPKPRTSLGRPALLAAYAPGQVRLKGALWEEPQRRGQAQERVERRIAVAGRLLPRAVRERQVNEWLDHLACELEDGNDPGRALWSIIFRSLIPIAVMARMRRLGRALADGHV